MEGGGVLTIVDHLVVGGLRPFFFYLAQCLDHRSARDETRRASLCSFYSFCCLVFFLFHVRGRLGGWALPKVLFFVFWYIFGMHGPVVCTVQQRGRRADDDTVRLRTDNESTGDNVAVSGSGTDAAAPPRNRRAGRVCLSPASTGQGAALLRHADTRPAKPTADACVRLRRVVSSTSSYVCALSISPTTDPARTPLVLPLVLLCFC